MTAKRIDQAIARITAAMERIEVAQAQSNEADSRNSETHNSPRVLELINAHEKLREEVADTIGELDSLIEELEA